MKKVVENTKNAAWLVLGVLSAGFGLKGFLIPNTFIDGGVTGISLLVSAVGGYNLSLLLVIINLPFVVFSFFVLGKGISLRAAVAIGALALCIMLVPYPAITRDGLLAAAFGGIFLGAGIGFAIRGGGVLDGTELMAWYLSKKLPATIGNIILLFNIFIFSAAALLLGVEPALYSILTYFAASKTVDFIINGIEGYRGVTIVSPRHEEIKQAILTNLERGVTVYRGKGGFSAEEKEILYCIITRLEIPRMRSLVKGIDEKAFMVVQHIGDVSGGLTRRRVNT